MILRWTLIVAMAALTISCGAQTPEGSEPDTTAARPPLVCPPDDYDVCLMEKAPSFYLRALAGGDIFDPVGIAQAACELPDADGCFMLGTLFEMNNETLQTMPAEVRSILKQDLAAAADAYEKSCALGSAMGCATAANLLAPDDETLRRADIDKQVLYMSYQKRSCDAGWMLSCEAFLYDGLLVSVEDWQGGAYAYYDEERHVSSILCAAGDLFGCQSEGVALMMMGYAEGGSPQELEAGSQLLLKNCAAGFEESCTLTNPDEQATASAPE